MLKTSLVARFRNTNTDSVAVVNKRFEKATKSVLERIFLNDGVLSRHMGSYTRRFFHDFAWVAIGSIIALLFGYFLRLLLARSFTVEEYGLVYAVMALFGLASAFQTFGLHEAIANFTVRHAMHGERSKTKEHMVWAAIVMLSSMIIISVFAFIIADWLGAAYFRNDAAPTLIRIYAFALFVSPLDLIVLSALQGWRRMDIYAIVTATKSITLFLITLLFINAQLGLTGVMIAYCAMYLVLYLLILPLCVRRAFPWLARQRFRLHRNTIVTMLRYGLPVMLTSVAAIILTYTDTILLTALSDLEQVGLYQAALPTANIMLFLVTAITTVLLPIIAELWNKHRTGLIAASLKEMYVYAIVCIIPPVVAAIIYPDIILNILFGGAYTSGANILRLLSIAVLFLTLNAVNSAVLSGITRPQDNTKAILIGAACNFLLNIALIPRYGGAGAATSTIISSIIIFSLSTYYVRKSVRTNPPLPQWFGAAIAGGVFAFVLWLSRSCFSGLYQYPRIALAVVCGVAGYIAVLLALRVVTIAEAKTILARIVKR